MTIRPNPIYVSYEVHRWLRLLAKAEPRPQNAQDSFESSIRIATPDEIADQILRQAIREQHPELPELQDKIDKLEKDLVKALKEGKK